MSSSGKEDRKKILKGSIGVTGDLSAGRVIRGGGPTGNIKPGNGKGRAATSGVGHSGKGAAERDMSEGGPDAEKIKDPLTLSPRLQQTLAGLLEGCSVRDIAVRLGLSVNTAEGYVKSLYRNMSVKSRGQLLALFVDRSLISKLKACRDTDSPEADRL